MTLSEQSEAPGRPEQSEAPGRPERHEHQIPPKELPGGFSRRAVAWCVGISAVAFAAIVGLAAWGDDPADHPTAGPSTLSYSALGHRGLADFLRRQGLGVTSRQSRGGAGAAGAAGLGARQPLVVAEPPASQSGASRLPRLARFIEEARTAGAPLVVVLPKWYGIPKEGRPDWVDHATILSPGAVERSIADLGAGSGAGSGLGARQPLVVAEPPASQGGASRLPRLARFIEEARAAGAPLVVVLPKWYGIPKEGRPDWVDHATILSPGAVERSIADLGAGSGAGSDGEWSHGLVARRPAGGEPHLCTVQWPAAAAPQVEIDSRPLQVLLPDEALIPEVVCGDDILVARLASSGTGSGTKADIFLLADPDLINNQGLGKGDHAALAWRLFAERLGARSVVFDETVHGYQKSRGLLAEAFRYPLLPATLQGLLLVAVILWAGMGRFGKPLPSSYGLPPGKEVLTDNTAQLLTRGGHGLDSLTRYYHHTLRAVAARYFLPADLPERELAGRLGELAARRGSRFDLAAFERQLAGLALQSAARGPRVAALARRLYDWRMEMTDGQ